MDHKKTREFQKNIYFCFIDYAKAFDCVDHNKLWKILKEMGIPEIKLPTSAGSWKKGREFQKNIYFCFIDYAKAFDCVDHKKLWKILKEMGIPNPDLPLEKSICRSGSNS